MTGFTEILCAVADFFSAVDGTFVSIAAVVTAIATIVIAIVAVLGYRRKRKPVGKKSFEAARNLLRATYKIQDAIQVCRNPFLAAHEFPEGYDFLSPDREKHENALMYLYNNRMKPVRSARQEFDLAAREAEVLWGSESAVKTKEMRSCVTKLNIDIRYQVQNTVSGGKYLERNKKFAEEMAFVVEDYGSIDTPEGEVENPFSKRVGNAVAEIEKHVRPYMPTRTNRHSRT